MNNKPVPSLIAEKHRWQCHRSINKTSHKIQKFEISALFLALQNLFALFVLTADKAHFDECHIRTNEFFFKYLQHRRLPRLGTFHRSSEGKRERRMYTESEAISQVLTV